MDFADRIARGCPSEIQNGEAQTKHHPCGCGKLSIYDWLEDIPQGNREHDIVEVRFKNTRKDYYLNPHKIPLRAGDMVVTEAQPGHDLGVVSLTGELVHESLKKGKRRISQDELKKVYRRARENDIDKWKEAISLERDTMLKSRQIATLLKLEMKIGDVEYQGDKTKAIFYYIAEGRVDFRELIKKLAEEFRIRVEMRQIGVRQEAGRIGGIGPCGRELCCATWISDFCSVSTSAAKKQDLSLNPQKLAGQCSKLKCCLNYELDVYNDALKEFPNTDVALETKEGRYYHQKSEVFKGLVWYSSKETGSSVMLTSKQAKEVLKMNRDGKQPDKLVSHVLEIETEKKLDYTYESEQDSLDRFSKKENKRKNKRRDKRRKGPGRNNRGRRNNKNENKQ